MKNEKMGETVSLGFTSTDHDPTRTPAPLSPSSFVPGAYPRSPMRLGWSVGQSVGWTHVAYVSATARPSLGHSVARADAFVNAREHATDTAVSNARARVRERRATTSMCGFARRRSAVVSVTCLALTTCAVAWWRRYYRVAQLGPNDLS